MTEDIVKENNEVKMKQRLSLLNGVTMVVGNIVGSGIFLTPKGVHEYIGSPAASLIIWTVSGVLSLVGAVCYAELGTTIVKSGASYSYIKDSFGPMLGFVRLWLSVLIIEPTVQAAIAVTFSEYLIKPFFDTCDPPIIAVRLVAAACCLFILAMNVKSVRIATRIQDAFSYAKIFALIVIMIAGLVTYFQDGVSTGALADPWNGTTWTSEGIVMSLYLGLYSYAGWDTLNFMVEELKNPYKNLPMAIYISMPLCTVVYLLANVAYYVVLSSEEMVNSNAVALTFATKTMGSYGWIMSIFVAMSCFGALNSSFYASSRLYFVGARENHLPNIFSMVSPKSFTPVPSLFLTGTLTLFYLFVEDVFELIEYYSFMYWLTVGLSIFGQIYLRFKKPEMPRPIKFSLFWPFLFGGFCIVLVVVPFYDALIKSLIGTALLATGFPLYFIFLYNKGRYTPAFCKTLTTTCSNFVQKLLVVLPESSEDE